MSRGKTIALAGQGGVGSHLAQLLPRIPAVGRVLLADHDRYGPENLAHQAISPEDIGANKAEAQAARLLTIRPDLKVLAMPRRIEDVPLGLLNCDLLVSCVDSRRVRVAMNQIALKLRLTMLDVGVNPHTGRVRAALLRPGPDSACLQCSMQERDYRNMETIAPCQARAAEQAPPSRLPVALSSLACALAVRVVQAVLDDQMPPDHIGTQWVMDMATLQTRRQDLGRVPSPTCLADHQTELHPEPLVVDIAEMCLGNLRDQLSVFTHIAIEGVSFVQRAWCPSCGFCRTTLHLRGRADPRCLSCGGAMHAADLRQNVAMDELSPGVLSLPLSTIGISHGDVLGLRGATGEVRHVVLCDSRCDWPVSSSGLERVV